MIGQTLHFTIIPIQEHPIPKDILNLLCQLFFSRQIFIMPRLVQATIKLWSTEVQLTYGAWIKDSLSGTYYVSLNWSSYHPFNLRMFNLYNKNWKDKINFSNHTSLFQSFRVVSSVSEEVQEMTKSFFLYWCKQML